MSLNFFGGQVLVFISATFLHILMLEEQQIFLELSVAFLELLRFEDLKRDLDLQAAEYGHEMVIFFKSDLLLSALSDLL